MVKKVLFIFLILYLNSIIAQNIVFTQQDSIRGSITKERVWWDLKHYDLHITVNPNKKYLSGKNSITYKVLNLDTIMQIDLQSPMNITKATQNNTPLLFTQNGNAYYIKLKQKQLKDSIYTVTIFFEGKPKEAKKAPWDGGITWKKDKNGNPFIASSCQGVGASLWWPCKDHMYDEVDSMDIHITTPKNIMNISNGRLKSITKNVSTKTYHWQVKNPINNYGVNMNIGNYTHFSDSYNGKKGVLTLDYYVLKHNVKKAKKQFTQVKLMLEAFEHWFGTYPFYKDGYKLVEVPYLGMEHQSCVTYGNNFKNGYLGKDLSKTGWGLLFDFIIIHESGHEWFANSITYKDIADMWIHESFTAYSESLYLEYHYGKKAGYEYVVGTRYKILNNKPIIGHYHVNKSGSVDMYYKGANMLHTLRQLVDNDTVWLNLLRGLNTTFYHQTVTTQQIENYISTYVNKDLTAFFEQYLRTTKVPQLVYRINKNKLEYKWTNTVTNFKMPVKVYFNKSEKWLYPTSKWKTIENKTLITYFTVNSNFHILKKQVN